MNRQLTRRPVFGIRKYFEFQVDRNAGRMKASSTQKPQQRTLAWYFRRLQSMPLAEIPHRIKETLYKQAWRIPAFVAKDRALPGDVLSGAVPRLPVKVEALESTLSEDDRRQLARDVDSLCNGKVELLGQEWPDGALCDWSLDPDSRNHWPWQRYTFDIPRRIGQGAGDVKFVWELSRLQHLQVLALGARLLDRDDARRHCLQQLENWLDNNPPYQGLGYACGIELASRVVSILFIVTCLGSSSVPASLAEKIWISLAVHGRWIARFPSLYSSANNHLVAEAAALVVLGTVAPQLSESAGWKSIGMRRLDVECRRQVLPDGVGAEQSPTYLAYTLEWLLLTRVVAQDEAMPSIDAALRRGAMFITSVADVRGNVPFFGDCDDGVVLRPVLKDANYLASIVTGVAGVLQSDEIAHPAFIPDLRARLLAGQPVPKNNTGLQSAVFEDGGYTVLRSGDGSHETYILFDHGPLGFAHTAAHGHADALAVWLHIDGMPVFVDFGTYRYNADSGWREWARHTAAHNTIEIDGESQSETTGPFNWGRRAQSLLLDVEIDTAVQRCRASHDGYKDLLGVMHERSITLDQSGSIGIADAISGEGSHVVKSSFHLCPDATAELLPGNKVRIRLRDASQLEITAESPGLRCNIVSQQAELQPGAGAVSRGYNDLTPAQSIVISGNVDLPYASTVTIRRA